MADIGPNDAFYFHYNSSGEMVGYTYKTAGGETQCVFVKNLQGDVEKVLNVETGAVLASYTYDAWGNVLTAAEAMAGINPIRYRGYYFDIETNLFYLQSRYYDSQIGRFINADAMIEGGLTTGINTFAYCFSNPVKSSDPKGFRQTEDIFDGHVSSIQSHTLYNGTSNTAAVTVKKLTIAQYYWHDCGGAIGYTDTATGTPMISANLVRYSGVNSLGVSGAMGWGLDSYFEIVYVEDGFNNRGVAITIGVGGGLGKTFGVSFLTHSTYSTIYDMRGPGVTVGGTLGPLGFSESAGNNGRGFSLAPWLSLGLDFHSNITYTWVIPIEGYS